MADNILTEEELGALLGDKDEGTPLADELSQHNDDAFLKVVQDALPAIKSEFSQKLGEEVVVNFLGVERTRTLPVDGGGSWYVAKGSFATNIQNEQFLIFPDVMAHELAKRVTGVDDIENTIENVSAPLKELSDNIVASFVSIVGDGFLGSLGEFQLYTDLAQIEVGENFLRAGFSVGESTFFYFCSASIVSILEKDTAESVVNASSEESSVDVSNVGEDFSSLLSDDSEKSDGQTNGKTESVFSSALSSLGDELLKEGSSISDVEFPAFQEGDSSISGGASEESKRIDMLMDVQVTISVELGNTRRTVEEVLELGRGSILDLNKLAGEPLDIKVNDKLIAKGEVVVIDENFGVRIVEIIASGDRLKK